ncbi:ubiquitin-like protein, putative [Plasmodium vivax]|nr:ubiquitin-like protein, putative [Plasmodium vivax]
MLDSPSSKEQEEPHAGLDSVDVSEYNHVINNSHSSEEENDESSSDDCIEGEEVPKGTHSGSGLYGDTEASPKGSCGKVNSDLAGGVTHADTECTKGPTGTGTLAKSDHEMGEQHTSGTGKKGRSRGQNESPNKGEKPNGHTHIYVRVKTNDCNNSTIKCKIEKNITVKKLKKSLRKILHSGEDEYRVIYRGRLLKDVDVLAKYNITFNDVLYAIRINRKKNGNDAILDSGITSSQLSTIGEEYNDFGKLPQNDNISKLISSMFDNSDFLKSIMDSNKQLQKLREKNSEIHHMLNDSQSLKQSFEMIKNPSLMKELMRNTDRAISNIEAIPGGFNTLRRMYHNIQEPMYAASEASNENKKNKVKHYDLKASSPPTSEAFPNPWASKDVNAKGKGSQSNDLDKYLLMNNNLFNNSSDLFKSGKKNRGPGLGGNGLWGNSLGGNGGLFKTNILDLLQNYQASPPSQLGGMSGASGASGVSGMNGLSGMSNLFSGAQMHNRQMYHGLLNSGLFSGGLLNNGSVNSGSAVSAPPGGDPSSSTHPSSTHPSGAHPSNAHPNGTHPAGGSPLGDLLNNSLFNDKLLFGSNFTNDFINQYAQVQKSKDESEGANSPNQVILNMKDQVNGHNDWKSNLNIPSVVSRKGEVAASKSSGARLGDEKEGAVDVANTTADVGNATADEGQLPFGGKRNASKNLAKEITAASKLEESDTKGGNDGAGNLHNLVNVTCPKGDNSTGEGSPNLLPNDVIRSNGGTTPSSALLNMQLGSGNLGGLSSTPLNILESHVNKLDLRSMSEAIKLLSSGGSGGGSGGGIFGGSAQSEQEHLCNLYAEQLNSLRGMGFTDEQKCIKALVSTQGNIERAIDFLLADMNADQS